ncbi:hypothetical protein GQ457_13G019930 [Hibiscus cannabinus]
MPCVPDVHSTSTLMNSAANTIISLPPSLAHSVQKGEKFESFGSKIIKSPKEFTYKELKEATRCFNDNKIIDHGAFETVYKGILFGNGDIITVKRCNHSTQGQAERNFVSLRFDARWDLDEAFYEARTPFTWVYRQEKKVLGVASTLAYLHQECDHQVIHRDVKTINIMLDEGFNAKLGDFFTLIFLHVSRSMSAIFTRQHTHVMLSRTKRLPNFER